MGSYVAGRRAVSRRLLLLISLVTLVSACRHPRSGDLQRLVETYDEISADVAWPGFDPADVPLALTDGSETYLIRHPSPPEAFRRLRGFRDIYAADTVLSELRANTDARIAGRWSATVLAPADDWNEDALAPLLVHEAFHAFQTVEHPDWTANEVDLFTYPVRSLQLLHLRRLETAALRRAVMAPDSVRELCWAQAFLRARDQRFRRLPAEASAYERGAELREGLARYIEAGLTDDAPALPGDGFPPEDVRERAYASGHAQAVLLDRMVRGWRDDVDGDTGLDGVLRAAIGSLRVRRCGAAPDEAGRTRTVARDDLARLARRESEARAGFERAAGWRIVVDAGEHALQPRQFDPLNVRVLEGREVLHERWIQLANEAVEIEVIGRSALTEGVGPHPMFNGVGRFLVTGLPEPDITTSGDTVRVAADGMTLRVVGAAVERDGQTTTFTLVRPSPTP